MPSLLRVAYLAAGTLMLQHLDGVSSAAIERRAANSYAPTTTTCPSASLVRSADGIGASESAYVTTRKANADAALASWLSATNSEFDTSSLPMVGFTVSGGGLRSLLCGAGVIQALDGRDSNVSTSGLYQSLTYHAGLSGGGWLLSSLAGNNWPTISSLKTNLWEGTFQDSLLDPEYLLAAVAYAEIVDDILAKAAAGFEPTLVDAYGRLLGYELLDGSDGGVAKTVSGLTSYSNFTSHAVPYPVITALGIGDTSSCIPADNATQYEITPYEFGSWQTGVEAFVLTEYLGSALTSGSSTDSNTCITNFDNLGFIAGTTSDVFEEACASIAPVNSSTNLAETLEAIILNAHDPVIEDLYARYPNPFYDYAPSSLVASATDLYLVDGGVSNQNVPIWPFLQPERDVGVLIANDNSADTSTDFPNGTELHHTYVQAQAQGLTKMPYIPPVETFVSEGLNTRATFFGCDDNSTITIVYLPNVAYTYASDVATTQLVYSKAETAAMIANGVEIATQNGTAGWATCLGCAVMMKTGTGLPGECAGCFDTYCYSG